MYNLNNVIKKYIIWGYFFFYPLVNGFIPNIDFGIVELDPFRLFLIIPIIYLFVLFFEKKGVLRISKENIFLFFYTFFALLNSWMQGHFIIANVINYSFPFLFLLCFDNLNFVKKDLENFYTMINVLAILVFFTSLIQKYIDHSFFSFSRGAQMLERYTYGGDQYRNASIFRSIDFYQAGIAIGVLCLIFLFLNHKKFNFLYSGLFILMTISTYFTYTRSNWIIPFIGIGWLLLFKPFNKKVLIISGSIIIILILYINFFSQLEKSELYRERITVRTYEGRFVSLDVYMKHFFGKNMVLGFGIDSFGSGAFREYGRNEVHNGYLEVLFQNGLFGLVLYFGFWYYILKKGILIYRILGNGVFIAFISVFIAINMTMKLISMGNYGFHMLIFYLYMHYRLFYKNKENENIHETSNNI